MDFLADFIMEFIPDVFTDFLGEKLHGILRERIENRYLRGVLYVLLVILMAAAGVGLAFGLLVLVIWVFGKL